MNFVVLSSSILYWNIILELSYRREYFCLYNGRDRFVISLHSSKNLFRSEIFTKGHNNNATRVVQSDIKVAAVIKGWLRDGGNARTRNSNKLLGGTCCTQVLRRRVPSWNSDRASDGLQYSTSKT